MEPTETPVIHKKVYITIATVGEANGEWFSIEGLGARFFCEHNFTSGELVKITMERLTTIEKVEPNAQTQHPPID